MVEFVYEMSNKPKVVDEMPKPPKWPWEVTSSASEKSAGNTDHEFAALVQKAGPKLTIKVLKEAFPAWKFEAYTDEEVAD